jgi:hypothetical protein
VAKEERKDVMDFYSLLDDIFQLHLKNGSKLSDDDKNYQIDKLRSLKTLMVKYERKEIENELRDALKGPMWKNVWAALDKKKLA